MAQKNNETVTPEAGGDVGPVRAYEEFRADRPCCGRRT